MKRLKKRADLKEFGTSLQNKGWHGSKGLESIFCHLFHSKNYELSHEVRRAGFDRSREQICAIPCNCGCKSGQ